MPLQQEAQDQHVYWEKQCFLAVTVLTVQVVVVIVVAEPIVAVEVAADWC